MSSVDRQRARMAHEHVRRVLEAQHKKYATLVHKLPALLSTAGLCQALHFIDSRGETAGNEFLDHLAEQLTRVDDSVGKDRRKLLQRTRDADSLKYLHLSREALACAAWYRRMVQGVLKIDAADADRQDGP